MDIQTLDQLLDHLRSNDFCEERQWLAGILNLLASAQPDESTRPGRHLAEVLDAAASVAWQGQPTLPQCRREFRDWNFDDNDFQDGISNLLGADWRDVSWKQDTCPRWTDGCDLWISADYADPAKREDPDAQRFCLYYYNEDTGTNLVLWSSDNWSDISLSLHHWDETFSQPRECGPAGWIVADSFWVSRIDEDGDEGHYLYQPACGGREVFRTRPDALARLFQYALSEGWGDCR